MRPAGSPALAWRLFRLHPGEGGRVLLFGLVGGLLQMGVAVGFTAADALFLTKVGVRGLPVVYLLTPLVMAAYVPIHAYLLGRLGVDRVMTLTLAALALGSALVWWAVHVAPGPPALYAAKMFSVLWGIGLYSLFWNWIDGFFDIQDAKRVYSLFGAGEAAGGVAGGVLAAFLVHSRPVEDLFLVWSALALLAIPTCSLVRGRHHRLDTEGEEDTSVGFAERTHRTVAAMRASPFVLILGIALVVGLFVITVTEYQYLGILSEGMGEEELASLLGTLLALVCVFNVAANLFFFNRLVLSVGVRNVILIPAAAYLLTFCLLLLQGGAAAAIFGFFTYHGILASIEYNNQNFLFHALPDGVRREVRTLLEGLAEPLATALGGAFLFLAATRMSPIQISAAGLGAAALYLGVALLLRRRYGPSLVANLRSRWLDLSRPAAEVLTDLSPDELASLHRYASHPDAEIALSALRILWASDCKSAVSETLCFLRDRPDGDRQKARTLLGNLLDTADPEEARPLVEWILEHLRELGPGFIEDLGSRGIVPTTEVEPFRSSSNPDEVAAAAVVLWRSPSPHTRKAALESLLGLLEADSPHARTAGVRVLGYLAGDSLSRQAAEWLDDRDPAIRAAAVTAIRKTATPGTSELVEPLLGLVCGTERLAITALEALARIADPAAVPHLVRAAEGYTPNVRRVVVRTLDRMGLKGVPQAVAAVRDPAVPYEGRILAARSLSHLAPGQLDALAADVQRVEVARAERCRDHARILSALEGAGASVLRRYYRDQQARITDYVLELLSVVGRVPDWQMLRRWLRGGSVKERADALETLDQALGRRESARLAPLLVGDRSAEASWGDHSVEALLERALGDRLGIGSAAAAVALWDRDAERTRPLLLEVLRSGPEPLVRDAVLDLLAPDPARGLDAVRVLHRLENALFFADIPLAEAQAMVFAGRQREVAPGEPLVRSGARTTELLALLVGRARVLPGDMEVGPGSILGMSALLPDTRARLDVVSLGCRVLSIPAVAVESAAQRSPAVAQALFMMRQEEADGAAA